MIGKRIASRQERAASLDGRLRSLPSATGQGEGERFFPEARPRFIDPAYPLTPGLSLRERDRSVALGRLVLGATVMQRTP
jgi:hypothetical protein